MANSFLPEDTMAPPTEPGKYEWTGMSGPQGQGGRDFVVIKDDDGQDVYVRPNAFPEHFAAALSSGADKDGRVSGMLQVRNKNGADVKFDPKYLIQHPQHVWEIENYDPDRSAKDEQSSQRRGQAWDNVKHVAGAAIETGNEFGRDLIIAPIAAGRYLMDPKTRGQIGDAISGAAEGLGSGVAWAGNQLMGDHFNKEKSPTKAPGKADPNQLVFAGAQPPPDNHVMLPPGGGQGGPGMGVGMSASYTGPTGNIPAEWVSKKDVQGAYGQLSSSQDALAAAAKHGYEREIAAREGQLKAQVESAATEQQVRNNVLQEQQEVLKTVDQARKDLLSPDATVDPQRWFHSRTTGQKLFAVLGSILGGFGAGLTGGSNQALNLVQQAIEDDIAAQKFDIEQRRARKRDAFDTATTFYGLMRQKGLDEVEATHAAKNLMMEQFESQLDLIAAQKGADMSEPALAEMKAKLQIEKQGLMEQMWQHRAQTALQKQHLALQAREIAAKQQGKHGGKEPIRGSQAVEFANALEAISATRDLAKRSEAVKGLKGFLALPGTEAGNFRTQEPASLQTVGKPMEGKALTEGDVVRYDKMMPTWTDFAPTIDAKNETLQQSAARKYETLYHAFASAGFDMGVLPTPKQLGALSPEAQQALIQRLRLAAEQGE